MSEETTTKIIILLAVFVVAGIIGAYFLKKILFPNNASKYDRVNQENEDIEENEKSVEMTENDGSYNELPDGDNPFSGDLDEMYGFEMDDDIGFGAKDRERLSMLDRYRNNLVAGASSMNTEEEEEEGESTTDDLRI